MSNLVLITLDRSSTNVQHLIDHMVDLSLKLESLTEVSWLMFMLESELEMLAMSELDLVEDKLVLEMVGEDRGSGPRSAK